MEYLDYNIGKTIRRLRKKNQYTKEDLALLINRSPSTIQTYEDNSTDCPVEVLFKIFHIFNKRFNNASLIEWELLDNEEEINETIRETVGQKIKSARQAQEINQQDLADYLNIARSTIAMYENGLRMPDIRTLIEISVFTENPLSYFLDIKIEDILKDFTYFYYKGTYGIKRGNIKFYSVSLLQEEIIKIVNYLNQYADISDCHVEYIIEDYLYENKKREH